MIMTIVIAIIMIIITMIMIIIIIIIILFLGSIIHPPSSIQDGVPGVAASRSRWP